MAYGARLESGLGVKALRGSNPLSSATEHQHRRHRPRTWPAVLLFRSADNADGYGTSSSTVATGFSNSPMRNDTCSRQVPDVGSTASAV